MVAKSARLRLGFGAVADLEGADITSFFGGVLAGDGRAQAGLAASGAAHEHEA